MCDLFVMPRRKAPPDAKENSNGPKSAASRPALEKRRKRRVVDLHRGDLCWFDYGYSRGLRVRPVLVELQSLHPEPMVRAVNSERHFTIEWSALEPLSEGDKLALHELFGEVFPHAWESELAEALAAAASKQCALGDVRWERGLSGSLSGVRRHAALTAAVAPIRSVRLGKGCTTPGCTFFDFHEGPCSFDLNLNPRSRCRRSTAR